MRPVVLNVSASLMPKPGISIQSNTPQKKFTGRNQIFKTISAILLITKLHPYAAAEAESNPLKENETLKTEAAPQKPVEPIELLPSRAEYKATWKKGIPISGTAVRELKKGRKGEWLYQFNVNSFIVDIHESVKMRWENGHVVPLNYKYLRSGFVKTREAKVDFDWQKMRVRNDVENKPWSMDIPKLALDKLGYQLQLRMDLAKGKEKVVYKIADGGRLKDFVFQVVGEETLNINLKSGTVDTVIVEKVRKVESKRKTRLWFAKQWDYLLVKMVQQESDGQKYEINLKNALVDDIVIK